MEYCVRLTVKWLTNGDSHPKPDDDYPGFMMPLARAVERGESTAASQSEAAESVLVLPPTRCRVCERRF